MFHRFSEYVEKKPWEVFSSEKTNRQLDFACLSRQFSNFGSQLDLEDINSEVSQVQLEKLPFKSIPAGSFCQ